MLTPQALLLLLLLLLLLTPLRPSIAGGSTAATTPNPSSFAFMLTMRIAHGIRLPKLLTGKRLAISRYMTELATTVTGDRRRMPSMPSDRHDQLLRDDFGLTILETRKNSLHVNGY